MVEDSEAEAKSATVSVGGVYANIVLSGNLGVS